jgi:hypothetical protein
LARKFNVCQSNILMIAERKTWNHVKPPKTNLEI